MPVAFTLIDSKIGKVEEILHEVLNIEEVVEAYSVTGPWTILAKIEAKKFEELTGVIPEKIHGIDGILDTLTLVAFGVSKKFRKEACEEARNLAEAEEYEKLYELCQNCEQAKYCAFGARVITFGF